jgi:AMMECR1 domain-containing protein
MRLRAVRGLREGRGLGGSLSVLLSLVMCLSAPARCDLVDEFAREQHGAGALALALARKAFDTYALRRERLPTPDDLPELLRARSGAFVSAVKGDAPRCCMGSLYPTQATIADEVIQAAVAAAGLDARKPPVTADELPKLHLIVSIVAPPESIADPRAIDPVTQGLAARARERTGVVLPGETPHLELAIKWARIRAGAAPDEPVEYFRVRAFRIAEPRGTDGHSPGRG